MSCILLLQQQGMATHIVGGEINYMYLGSDNYQISVAVYRDCYNGQAPYDDPISVGIFNSNDSLLQTVYIPFPGSTPIPAAINSPCMSPPTDVCYEKAIYIDTVNLPPIPGGYQIAYQRCCRNVTLINVQNPNQTGFTAYASIPGSNSFYKNSNPVFKNLPPPFICNNVPFSFDASATDVDGDSLVYTLCTPLDGANQTVPEPDPPNPPPYTNIVWQSGYSTSNMLGGIPLTIDPQTGHLTATPNTVGQFAIGICVEEYRNGVYLGETKRDFELNVVDCQNIVVASIQSNWVFCDSNTAVFQNQSVGANTYYWNFGDPNTTTDTSSAVSPSYTYADTGTYQVTLVAYSPQNIACNDTSIGTVHIYPPVNPNFTLNKGCNDSIYFIDSTNSYSPETAWHWDFGDGASQSTIQNPLHIYSDTGTYNVQFEVTTANGCKDTITKPLAVDVMMHPDFSVVAACLNDSTRFVDSTMAIGEHAIAWQWDFGDPASGNSNSATQQNPSHVYTSLGAYVVHMQVTTNLGCTDTVTRSIQVYDNPNAAFSVDSNYSCTYQCLNFTDSSAIGSGSQIAGWYWNFGDGDTSTAQNPTHCYQQPGNYSVSLEVTSDHGCKDAISKSNLITVYPVPAAAFVPDSISVSIFTPTIHFTDQTSGSIYWNWNFGDGDTLTSPYSTNPVHTYQDTGRYPVSLIAMNQYGCVDTTVVDVYVRPEFTFYMPNAFSPNGDGVNDYFYGKGIGIASYDLRIFDRWGHQLFHTNDINAKWDGRVKGKLVQEDVYVWVVTLYDVFHKRHKYVGHVTVVR